MRQKINSSNHPQCPPNSYVCMRTYVYMYVYMCICMRMCAYACVHMCMCMCMCIWIPHIHSRYISSLSLSLFCSVLFCSVLFCFSHSLTLLCFSHFTLCRSLSLSHFTHSLLSLYRSIISSVSLTLSDSTHIHTLSIHSLSSLSFFTISICLSPSLSVSHSLSLTLFLSSHCYRSVVSSVNIAQKLISLSLPLNSHYLSLTISICLPLSFSHSLSLYLSLLPIRRFQCLYRPKVYRNESSESVLCTSSTIYVHLI